jgi:OOP family OmpA-OmpF porin
MKENPEVTVEIAGHTDSVGNATYNRELSERRANSVRKFFLDNGVAASRLKAVGYGEQQPIADNLTEAGRARNRRVELRVSVDDGKSGTEPELE